MRRTVGLGLTGIVVVFIGYNLIGHWFPGALGHGRISLNHFLDISLYTTDGLFGIPIRVAGSYVFLFVMFGTILSRTGGSEFFFQLAAWLSGRQAGGQAKVAVVGSGVYGMISGSPVSDVVTTGSITIPMMIRTGFKPAVAAAVEVASSAGGGLMPPVMGSAAFIMAEYTGIPYREIIIAAVIPALLYYLAIFMQVDVRARRYGLKGLNGKAISPLSKTIRSGGLFVAPLVAVTWGLLSGYTPTYSGIFGVMATVIVALIYNAGKADWSRGLFSVLRELGRITFDLLSETSLRMVGVAGACAAAGLVIGTISMTGLAGKFSGLIIMLAGQNEFVTLLFAGLLTIILGLGMPTPSAYILAAVLIGPRLAELGFSLMGSHLLLIYFAVLSALTPPVAVAAYAASAIARENPLKIAAYATRIAIVAFILPFVFVYSPELLMQGGWLNIIAATTVVSFSIIALSVGIEGYLFRELNIPERLIIIAAALSAMTLTRYGVTLLVVGAIVLYIRTKDAKNIASQ
jgi:TRAP transporter 4TM/12TM fusion protein